MKDSGHNNIVCVANGDTMIIKKENGKECRKTNTLRFTQIQRCRETKSKNNFRRMKNNKKI